MNKKFWTTLQIAVYKQIWLVLNENLGGWKWGRAPLRAEYPDMLMSNNNLALHIHNSKLLYDVKKNSDISERVQIYTCLNKLHI